jgi:hypothetical protein
MSVDDLRDERYDLRDERLRPMASVMSVDGLRDER